MRNKEILDISKSALGVKLSKVAKERASKRLAASHIEKFMKETGAELKAIFEQKEWTDKEIWVVGFSLQYLFGAKRVDRKRFWDFLEARGVDRGLLEEGEEFARTEGESYVMIRARIAEVKSVL